jgi:hypothetical protein
MLIAVLACIIMLGMLDRAVRIGRVELLILRTRHKIFALRDLLRNSAIWGEIDPNRYPFDLIDQSLTKAAAGLKPLTFSDAFGFGLSQLVFNPNLDDPFYAPYFEFKRTIEKPEHHRLRAIADAYSKCIDEFIEERNRLGYTIASTIHHLIANVAGDGEPRLLAKPDLKQRAFTGPLQHTADRMTERC